MKDNQAKWIGEISDAMENIEAAEKQTRDREAGMALVSDKLINSKGIEEIRDAFQQVKVELENGKSMPLLDVGSNDPMKEIDSYADMPGAKPVDPEKLKALQLQFDRIVEVQRELQELDLYKIDLEKAPFVDEQGNPAYDPDLPTFEQQRVIDEKNNAMARDLWQPLMREGVIPENMIPDKYSEVAQTFAGASEAYEARLQEHSKNMSSADVFLEKFAPVKDIGGKVIAAAGSFAGFTGDVAALAENSSVIADAKEASEIIGLIDVAFTATCAMVPIVVKERDAIKAVDVFNDALGKVLVGAGVDPDVTKMINGIITAGARSAGTGKALAAGDFGAAFDELGKAIGAGFGASGDPQFKEIGAQIQQVVSSMGAAAKATTAMTKKPPEPGTAIQILLSQASTFAKAPEIKTVLTILADGAGALPQAYADRDAFAVMDFVAGSVSKSMQVGGVDPQIANAVDASISAAISGAGAGKKLAEGDVAGAFEAVGSGISTSLSKTGDENVAQIGNLIEKAVSTAASTGKFISAMNENPRNIDAAVKEMTNAINSAIGDKGFKSSVEALSGDVKEDDPNDPLAKVVGKINEVTSSEAAAAALELTNMKLEKPAPITKEQLEALEKARQEEEERAARSEEEKLRAFMDAEDAEFQAMLVTGMGPVEGEGQEIAAAEERRLKSIESMIAVVQRDKKTFELAQKICTKGPQLLADLVPGMGLASACAELAFQIAEAVKHAEQLVIWMDSVEDAGKAATVQLDAMMNRYGLEKQQTLRVSIKIGIQAVKIAGEATKLSPAAPIGLAISSGATATAAGFEVAWATQDFVQFQQAWSTYKTALENPQNRKAARTALRKNATLSKYAMAYGALKDGNAIAKEALRRCNITEATLVQPETNVDKLVEYLETLYSDDPVIVKAVPVRNEWYPGEVELNYRSFSRFYMKAVSEGKMAKDDVSKVKGALSAADRSYSEFNRLRGLGLKEGKAMPLDAEKTAMDDTKALIKALKAHKASAEDGTRHKEFEDYCKTLAAQATLRWREIQKIAGQEQQPLRDKEKREQEAKEKEQVKEEEPVT